VTVVLPALVTLTLLAGPGVAYAEPDRPTACAEVEGEAPCYLERGKRATYGGELWPSAFALAVLEDRAAGQRAEAEAAKARADLEAERKGRAIDRTEAEAVLAAERAAHAKTRELARALVEPPAWYERPAFIIPATVAVTLGVVLGVVYALR
jgi:hypothetical protein